MTFLSKLSEGKLTIEQLKRLVFKNISSFRKEVLTHPYIGQDCGIFDPSNNIISISSDPITGATENIGRLSVEVNLNDIAASGAEPFAITVTLLCPVGTKEDEIKKIMMEIDETAKEKNVQVIGGHTEITSSVNRTIVSITALGILNRETYDENIEIKEGFDIYITKDAGLEGTYIIGTEKQNELKDILDEEDITKLKKYSTLLSVIEDARLAKKFGALLMHDITEGGILGAVWESCELVGLGAKIYKDQISISNTTKKISNHFNINPLKLISSGSLLFFASKENREAIKLAFEDKEIELSRIGITTKENEIILIDKDEEIMVEKPQSDELYKVI